MLYAISTRDLLDGVRRLRARLVFLGGEAPVQHALQDVDGAITSLDTHLQAAAASLRVGSALPGLDASLLLAAGRPLRSALYSRGDGIYPLGVVRERNC